MQSRKPLWKRPKVWCSVFFFAIAFLLLGMFILTRSFVLTPIIAQIIGNQIEADVQIESVDWHWPSTLVLTDVEVHASGIDGPASRVGYFDTATVHITNSFPWQDPKIDSISVNNATFRMAESELQTGEFNFSSFMLKEQQVTEEHTKPSDNKRASTDEHMDLGMFTTVDLTSLTFEIGTMNAQSWELEHTVVFDVELNPVRDRVYQLALKNEDGSIKLEGSCDFVTPKLDLKIDSMQLDDGLFAMLPKTARVWVAGIGLKGDIGELALSWDPSIGFQFDVDVKAMEFNLPSEHSLTWVHYEDGRITKMYGEPTLRVESGKILYDGSSASLQHITGILLPPETSSGSSEVPFDATIQIRELPSLQNLTAEEWLDEMQNTSPFVASFKMDQFRSKVGGAGQVDLPLRVAKILQLFQLKDWNVNGQLIVERSKKNGDISYKGNVAVTGGSGWYEGFAYPLHHVKALIDVQNDTFTIQSFDALGSDEAAISIRGQVIAKEETHVDITLSARDAPLDQALHDAVPKPVATVMDRLLDQNALDRLVHKGLLRPDEFKLGGTVDMTLVIQHSGKNGESVQVSGDLNFKDTTIIHEGFPFPILVEDGSVQLEPERIFVPVKDRLKFVGYTGGEGSLAGAINFDQDGNTNPNIAAVLKNVPISELMVEAVSVSSGSSYQTTSQVLGGLGLEGQFDASGSVMTSEHGEIIQNIEVTIDESTATPKPSFAKAIQSSNAFWPEGFELFDVTSNVLIDNQGVHIKEVQARFEENGRLHAAMDIQGGAYDLEIQGENWPISPKLVNLLPPTACMKLSPAWEIFEPSGTFNTEIHLTHTNGTSSFHLQAEPTTLGITGGGSTMVMQRESGGIIVSDSNVYLNDLQFSIAQNDSIQGAVAFDGTIFAREERTDYDIQGEWTNAEASSPLSRAITGIIGGDTGLEYYDSLSPNGTGLVSLETVRNDDLDFYRVIVSPETLSATFNERVANATFLTTDSSFKNEIVFDNTGITFDRLGGTLGEGVFSLLGKINTEQNVSGSVVLDWDGRADDKNLFAVLPSVVGDTLEAMEIGEGTSRVVGGEVSFIGGSWSDLEIDFEGEIDLNGVSMNAGIPLSDIDGVTKVEGIYDEEKLTSLQVLLDIDEMTAVGREITDIHGGLLLDPQQGKMVFNDLRGESSSGVVTITGFVDVGETKKYQVTVLLSGVQLDDRSDSEASTFSGDLTGWLAIEGVRGAVHDRVGVGRLQVSQGMFAEVPIAMRFMQLLQLSLPTSESITNVVIDLSIDGDEVQLNNIKLTGDDTSAQGLVIQGEGKLEMPSFEIDVELHPRMGWPVLRDIAGVLGDQFFSIRAKGQLLEPEIAIVPLPTLLNED